MRDMQNLCHGRVSVGGNWRDLGRVAHEMLGKLVAAARDDKLSELGASEGLPSLYFVLP